MLYRIPFERYTIKGWQSLLVRLSICSKCFSFRMITQFTFDPALGMADESTQVTSKFCRSCQTIFILAVDKLINKEESKKEIK